MNEQRRATVPSLSSTDERVRQYKMAFRMKNDEAERKFPHFKIHSCRLRNENFFNPLAHAKNLKFILGKLKIR